MKYSLGVLWLGFTTMVTSCKFETPSDMPVLSAEPLPRAQPQIRISDSSFYSKPFLESLKALDFAHIELNKNQFIADSDTFYFPEKPEIGKSMIFTGRQDNLVVGLTVDRINYSTIKFKVEMVEFGKNNHLYLAQAHLSPDFYKSDQVEKVAHTDHEVTVSEYTTSDNSCSVIIRLGIDDANDNLLIARLIKNCNGKIRDLKADDFPILHEK